MDRNRQQERGVARLAGCCDKWKQTHRKALRHKSQSMCPVLCSSSPCYYDGPSRDACATSPWRPTRRDSLNVSGHKWYTYHIFLFFVGAPFASAFDLPVSCHSAHIHQAMHDWSAPHSMQQFTHYCLSTVDWVCSVYGQLMRPIVLVCLRIM